MDILYYGRLRDEIGRDREALDPPSHLLTVDDLLDWLRAQGEPYASALAEVPGLRAAIGDDFVGRGGSLFGAVEVALLPPAGVL